MSSININVKMNVHTAYPRILRQTLPFSIQVGVEPDSSISCCHENDMWRFDWILRSKTDLKVKKNPPAYGVPRGPMTSA